MVGLDEAHTTHISSQIEDMVDFLSHLQAIIHDSEINKMEFMAEHILCHVFILLPVRSNDVMAFALQTPGNVGSYKATSASDGDCQFLRRPIRLSFKLLISIRAIIGFPCAPHSAPTKGRWISQRMDREIRVSYKFQTNQTKTQHTQ